MSKIMHYWTNFPQSDTGNYTTACTKDGKYSNANVWPTLVTCKLCKATKKYRNDLLAFEIGYDCDRALWTQYQISLKHQPKKESENV